MLPFDDTELSALSAKFGHQFSNFFPFYRQSTFHHLNVEYFEQLFARPLLVGQALEILPVLPQLRNRLLRLPYPGRSLVLAKGVQGKANSV